MTTYDTVLSATDIMAISDKFSEYIQDLDASVYFPLIDDSKDHFNALKYRHIKLQKSTRSEGKGDRFSETGTKAQTGHYFDDFYLGAREFILELPKTKVNNWLPEALLEKKRAGAMRQAVKDIDGQMFYGCYRDPDDRDGLLDDGGFIAQATTVENLNGTDSDLTTKGDAWKGIKKMVQTIPIEKRRALANMILMISENLYNKLSDPNRVYEGILTEMKVIEGQFMSPNTPKQVKIDKIVITNDILIDGTDTKGTHDRMALYIPDDSVLGRVNSLPLQPIGESVRPFSVNQIWAYRGSLLVFDAECALLSEQISYS